KVGPGSLRLHSGAVTSPARASSPPHGFSSLRCTQGKTRSARNATGRITASRANRPVSRIVSVFPDPAVASNVRAMPCNRKVIRRSYWPGGVSGRFVVLVALVLTACGGAHQNDTKAPSSAGTRTPSLRGALTVFAAASLTESFDQAKTALTATNPRLRLSYSFAGSQALAAQIDQGAPADVFASADDATMRKLVDAGLVDAPVVFAR